MGIKPKGIYSVGAYVYVYETKKTNLPAL